MSDVHSKEIRSYNMSQIKGKNTKPEIMVRKFLFSHRLRFRIHVKSLPGKPDIVLPKYQTVIFVHGCFWHGHSGCKFFIIPKTRTDWWLNKIQLNRKNDIENRKKLTDLGWRVVWIFECELKTKVLSDNLSKILIDLQNISVRNEQ
jgi:DNA mismatch endonuclease (patch repair protein)